MNPRPMDPDSIDKLGDHKERADRHRRWAYARKPKKLGDVLNQVVAKRGYAATQASEELSRAWAEAAGPALAQHTRALGVRRGVLEVLVASSPMMQEAQFQQQRLLAEVQRLLPAARVTAIKLRVGRVR